MWIAKRHIFALAVSIFGLGQFPALVTSEQENHLIVQQKSKQESTADLSLQSPKDDSLELEPLCSDDFSTDSRADYKIGGPEGAVLWEVGKLSIGEKGSLRQELDTGGWIELEADLTFEELTDANPQSELRVVMEIEDSTTCYLQLQQRLRDGKVQSKLAVFDTPGPDSGRFLPEKIDELAMDGPLPSGRWRIGYRYGFWTVQSPDTKFTFFALVQSDVSRILAFRLEARKARIRLHRIGLQGCGWYSAPLTGAQKAELAIRDQRNNQAFELFQAGKRLEALPLLEESLAIQSNVLGKDHPDYATSLHNLAMLHHGTGAYERALPLLEESLAVKAKFLGKEHPSYASGLNNFADLQRDLGAYNRALQLYEETLAIRAKLLGKEHPDYAVSLSNLAALYGKKGAYERAMPLLEESLVIQAKVLGKEHPRYALSLNSLALLHHSLGAFERALPLLEEALAILAKVLGKEHPEYATILNNVAMLHRDMRAYDRALPLFEEALAIQVKAHGKEHSSYATSLSNFAGLHRDIGAYERALPLLEEAHAVTAKVLGKEHPDYASSLNNLALMHQDMGAYERALPLNEEALAIRVKVLGKEHPDYAGSLNNLAMLHRDMRAYERALPLFEEAIAITARHLENTSAVQSEQQQMLMSHSVEHQVRNMIGLLAESGNPAAELLSPVLRWKGATFARQRLMRLAQESGDADVQAELSELQSLSSRLANLTLAVPGDEAKRGPWRQQLDELNSQREQLERQLSAASVEFRALKAQSQIGLREVQSALPADTALVDLREYSRKLETKNQYGVPNYERSYCALVIRTGKPARLVELGSKARTVELIGLWRQGYGQSTASEADPGGALRELLWKPLVPELEGTKTVIVSPDGPLAMLPWGALPGSQPGSYLIEEFAFVTVPVPILLPEMMRVPHVADATALASMLLVGDVDYGASSGQSEQVAFSRSAPIVPGGGLRAWAPLDDTRREISAIRDSFELNFPGGHVTMLRRGEATEGALRSNAPAHRFLHIATHGYFARESMKSALASNSGEQQRLLGGRERSGPTGYHPGVLSGLVMAGANNEPLPNRDDGIMTALEVGDLDLRQVDSVVLSACSTGLGQVAGGEGILGLQRSFQIAGARTTVTSLWDVDSAATKELMIRFYENLYHADPSKRAPSRIEALRRAQLDLLHNPQFSRGGEDELADTDPPNRLPPKYWAAWVLSGDWR